MKRPTPDEMKAEAERQWERAQQYQQVCQQIEAAFAKVVLGNGVGLYEAQGIDDYADAATCARYRARDEKQDWRRITADALNECNSSLSFFDAEGMRFNLPAYLIADLRGEYKCGMVFCLSHLSEYSISKFTLLSSEQRQAVRAYLLHIIDDPDNSFDKPHILRSLDEYWIGPGKTKTD